MKFLDKRYIRLHYADHSTGWKLHTRKLHRQLVENPPERVEIHLCDYYPGLPEGSATTELVSFPVFHLIGREAILQDEAQQAVDKLHIDERGMEDYILADEGERHLFRSAEDDFFREERQRELLHFLDSLTALQRERFLLHFVFGYSYVEIARMQKCLERNVKKSAYVALEKIKKFLAK